MSAWYSISGTVRVRRCPEVDAIAAKIRAHCDRAFAVNLVPMDAEVGDFSIEGTGEFAAGGVLVLDELLESLAHSGCSSNGACLTDSDGRGALPGHCSQALSVAGWRAEFGCWTERVLESIDADATGIPFPQII